jgi:preprotein translocase subunit SecY
MDSFNEYSFAKTARASKCRQSTRNHVITLIAQIIKHQQSKLKLTAAGIIALILICRMPIPFIVIRYEETNTQFIQALDIFSGGSIFRLSLAFFGLYPFFMATGVYSILNLRMTYLHRLPDWHNSNSVTLITGCITFMLSGYLLYRNGSTYLDCHGVPLLLVYFVISLTLTTSTIFILYITRIINQEGYGNGVKLALFVFGVLGMRDQSGGVRFLASQISIIGWVVIISLLTFHCAISIAIAKGKRLIPIQNPRRLVGAKLMGGESRFLGFQISPSCQFPIILSPILILLLQLIGALPGFVVDNLSGESIYKLCVLFVSGTFEIFLVSLAITIFISLYFECGDLINSLSSDDIADNLKKSGGFIPGIRPGAKTSEYIFYVILRIIPLRVFVNVYYVIFLYVCVVVFQAVGLSISFSLAWSLVIISLIGVDVALSYYEIIRHLESERNYRGFLAKERLRTRNNPAQ